MKTILPGNHANSLYLWNFKRFESQKDQKALAGISAQLPILKEFLEGRSRADRKCLAVGTTSRGSHDVQMSRPAQPVRLV
jgi:hypothetical protein